MRNRTKALAALAAGTALMLTSGATFALWGDGAVIDAAPIATGDLSLTHDAEVTWWVVRADDPDTEVPMGYTDDEQTWLTGAVLPGDALIARTNVRASLAGTNLVARLTTGDVTGYDTWFDRYGETTVIVGDEAAGQSSVGDLAADRTVPITVRFDFGAYHLEPDDVPAGLNLGQLTLVLQQERAASGG